MFPSFADKEEVPVLEVSMSSRRTIMPRTQVAFPWLFMALASVFLDEKAVYLHVQIGYFSCYLGIIMNMAGVAYIVLGMSSTRG